MPGRRHRNDQTLPARTRRARTLPARMPRARTARARTVRARAGGGPVGEAGYSVVEVAVTFPVLLLLVLGVVQFALVWHARHVAQAAAQDGLRAARAYTGTAQLGEQDARGYLAQVAPRLLPHPAVQVQRSATTVTVRVHAGVLSVVPLGLGVDESAAGPVERFVAPAGQITNVGGAG